MSAKKMEMDMTQGSLMKKLVLYAMPLLATGVLQLLFNAADIVVVGRFAGKTALAAVGSTASLTNLLVNVFMMTSVGVSVVVAQHYGAHEYDEVERTVSTAMLFSVVIGVFVGIFGAVMSKRLLLMMGSPDDVVDQAALYMKIYFMGIPAFMAYNFGAAVLRAIGDTRRPLMFLTIAGAINVVLNLITVIGFRMGVAGVAIATAVSQYVSAIFVVTALVRSNSCIHLDFKHMKYHGDKLSMILKIGLPAGIQSAMFSISNVLIQSSINSFGSAVMAGSSAASNIEGFIYVGMNSIVQSSMTFTGQNMGAKKYHNISKVLWYCFALQLMVGGLMGAAGYVFSDKLIRIYSTDAEVIMWGISRLCIICSTYWIMGIMDVIVGVMRGMGNSTLPMLISVFFICGFRIIWIYTIFASFRSFEMLLYSYPVSWILALTGQTICYIFTKRRVMKQAQLEMAAA